MDDGYDYRITDLLMEDAFQANKRKNEEKQRDAIKRAQTENRIYILYVEIPGAGGWINRYSDYELAKREAIEIHRNYMEAFIEVSLKGCPLLTYPGHN